MEVPKHEVKLKASSTKRELRNRHRKLKDQHLSSSRRTMNTTDFGLSFKQKPCPKLEDARGYPSRAYEPRFEWDPTKVNHPERKLLPPGARHGEVFPLNATTVWELGSFGPGMGLLFHTIRGVGLTLLLSIVALAPVLAHYSSPAYSRKPFTGDVRILGSAVCLDVEEVNVTSAAGGLTTVLLSHCHFTLRQAESDCVCATAIFLGIVLLGRLGTSYNQKIDDAFQTAQDYSVLVEDPPKDAADPDEWYTFSRIAHF
jgi:hypothetical protein